MPKNIVGQIHPLVAAIDNPEITDLPFVKDTSKGKKAYRSFWSVNPNGDMVTNA